MRARASSPPPSLKPPRRPRDFSQRALQIVNELTGVSPKAEPEPERPKNPHAVALSKLGAAKGGKARAAKLTPEQRAEAARKAARARWKKP